MRKRISAALLAAALVAAFWLGYAVQPAQETVGCREEDLAQVTDVSFMPTEIAVDTGEVPKRVCLTFDDGPSKNTPAVLAILQQEDVPATFFVISAENNQQYLPLVQQEMEQGEQIGLHSASHDYKKIYASTDAYWSDIDNLKQELSAYIDVSGIDCLRFPGGSTNTISHRYGGSDIMKTLKVQAEEKGYHAIDWNVCADDAAGGHPSASEVYQNTIEDVEDKRTCVVLMHDTNATTTTVEALPDIIAWFRDQGYTFCTVDDLYV
ncbi:MAG: polysaccharide deacetylase [Faecalibacterium sp.]|jgi:peptidoglycan/xylan/chitin deacetylase (PgdA/CDA1 family)|nr:polysaccharide deacetylase [Faecalibacterium sp.]